MKSPASKITLDSRLRGNDINKVLRINLDSGYFFFRYAPEKIPG